MPHTHTICNPTQLVRSNRNGAVEVQAPLEGCAREQLRADILQFRAEAEEKATTLSGVDFFYWLKGVEDSLELGRQRWYDKYGTGLFSPPTLA
jgi:hypothetical protein